MMGGARAAATSPRALARLAKALEQTPMSPVSPKDTWYVVDGAFSRRLAALAASDGKMTRGPGEEGDDQEAEAGEEQEEEEAENPQGPLLRVRNRKLLAQSAAELPRATKQSLLKDDVLYQQGHCFVLVDSECWNVIESLVDVDVSIPRGCFLLSTGVCKVEVQPLHLSVVLAAAAAAVTAGASSSLGRAAGAATAGELDTSCTPPSSATARGTEVASVVTGVATAREMTCDDGAADDAQELSSICYEDSDMPPAAEGGPTDADSSQTHLLLQTAKTLKTSHGFTLQGLIEEVERTRTKRTRKRTRRPTKRKGRAGRSRIRI
eukprot:GHVT01026241.1.p1 GENE.GHVT01026241.1~~GHVT01026241.1.p1  ORF type:complete len:322 (+),score=73.99 GHVT01026241.1:627-1592(+)